MLPSPKYNQRHISSVDVRNIFDFSCNISAGSEADPHPAAGGADRLPAAEQPDGVLVHGRLGAAQLPRQQDGVLQHVREAHPER